MTLPRSAFRAHETILFLITFLLNFFFWVAEKLARGTGDDTASKDVEELDQLAGNAEDGIGERIAALRKSELLYGPDSFRGLHGPLYFRSHLRRLASHTRSK